MALTAGEITAIGKATIDFFLKNNPVDQIGKAKPLLDTLRKKQKTFPGSKDLIVEQLRTAYGSNFQWVKGASTVTYNNRDTLDQAMFPWSGAHDGLALSEDMLVSNGIIVHDGKPGKSSKAERIQLTNLVTEQTESLMEGFKESFDYQLHLDGTASADAVAGLDFLLSTTPAVGTVGGINRATATWWRNNHIAAVAAGNLLSTMEAQWRACKRYAKNGAPDLYLCGEAFYDTYVAQSTANGRIIVQNGDQAGVEGAHGDVRFKGRPLIIDDTFADLDAALAPPNPWAKRCYMINTNHMRLRPAEGQDIITRTPPRQYNKYEYYWALTWKGGLSINHARAHSVIEIA